MRPNDFYRVRGSGEPDRPTQSQKSPIRVGHELLGGHDQYMGEMPIELVHACFEWMIGHFPAFVLKEGFDSDGLAEGCFDDLRGIYADAWTFAEFQVGKHPDTAPEQVYELVDVFERVLEMKGLLK